MAPKDLTAAEMSRDNPNPNPEDDPPRNNNKAKKLDMGALKKRLSAEDKFIGDLLGLLNVPKHKLQNGQGQDELEDDDLDDVVDGGKSLLGRNKTDRAKSLTELHQRLHNKMAELRGDRKEGQGQDDSKKKGKKGKAKLTKVERRKKAIEDKKLKKKLAQAGKEIVQNKAKANAKAKPSVKNSEGKVIFSKFDFTTDPTIASAKKAVDNPKEALSKLEKKKEKLKSLESKGQTEKVVEMEEKSAWKTAMDKASGVKVKDDAGLLKKSIKKQEQRKKSSKKKWEERNKGVESRKEAKQNKRKDNLKQRKDQVKEKKMKKLAKKGRMVPGF